MSPGSKYSSDHLVWQTSGVPDDEKVAALKEALAKLLPAQQPLKAEQ